MSRLMPSILSSAEVSKGSANIVMDKDQTLSDSYQLSPGSSPVRF